MKHLKKLKLFESNATLRDVYNTLRHKMGRNIVIHVENDNVIDCGVRDWGRWEHDYDDYERSGSDYEDDDQMILSYKSTNLLRSIVNKVEEQYPNFKIDWTVSEKNWIDFIIERKN